MHAGTLARTSPAGNPANNFPNLTDLNLLPDANIVNLRFDYDLGWREKTRIFLAVDNVLNSKYAYTLETNSSGAKGYYYMPGTTFSVGLSLNY
ncbi:MAG TPA: hypothetical protein VMG30_06320 [Acidobacteriota bacterium]|nr:hypothetical protein [Acidobacteriota bacterium]